MASDGKQALLKQIYDVGFAVDEVKLFLDTHPNDMAALNYYKKYRETLHNLTEEFNEKYGPLTADNMLANNQWTWINGPWPWEGQA